LKNIVSGIQVYIENHPMVSKEETRVRLYDFDSNAINIMILYFVNSIEYNVYLNVREEINYKILEIIEKYESSIAHPTIAMSR